MKKMIFASLSFLLMNGGFLNLSFADELILADGIYDTDSGVCAFRIINDISNHSLIWSGTSVSGKLCGDDSSFEGKQNSSSEFSYYYPAHTVVISDNAVAACRPTQKKPKPCDEHFYSQGGQLLIMSGDINTVAGVVDLLDHRAFRFSAHRRVLRDGQILIDFKVPSFDHVFYLTK